MKSLTLLTCLTCALSLPSLNQLSQFPLSHSQLSQLDQQYKSYSGHSLWLFHFPNQLNDTFLSAARALHLDVWRLSQNDAHVQLPPLSPQNVHTLLESFRQIIGDQLNTTLLIPDIGALIPSTPPITAYYSHSYQLGPSSEHLQTPAPPSPHERYHPAAAVHSLMYQMEADFPGLAQVINIGQTEEGNDVLALKVGYLVDNDLSNGRKRRGTGEEEEEEDMDPVGFAIISGLHAREWIGPAASLYAAHSTLNSLSTGPSSDLADLFSAITMTFIPLVNVDGYTYTWTTDRLWKKNRQVLSPDCVGLDLNKNFGSHFNPSIVCDDATAGTKPFQASELAALRDYLVDPLQNFKGLLDVHSFGQVVMFPFSFSCGEQPKDGENLFEAAVRAAKRAMLNGKTYSSKSACSRHAKGESIDWAYEHMRWSFYTELRDLGTYGFLLPQSEIVPAGQELMSMLIELATFMKTHET